MAVFCPSLARNSDLPLAKLRLFLVELCLGCSCFERGRLVQTTWRQNWHRYSKGGFHPENEKAGKWVRYQKTCTFPCSLDLKLGPVTVPVGRSSRRPGDGNGCKWLVYFIISFYLHSAIKYRVAAFALSRLWGNTANLFTSIPNMSVCFHRNG